MRGTLGVARFVAALVAGSLVASAGLAATGLELPELVAKTFKAQFPKGQIEKLDATEENGVMVYDIEFKDGTVEKETDIAEDGTMLEFTVVIKSKKVPGAAMKSMKEAAKGAKMGRLEEIQITYETKDGKVVKLPAQKTHYAAELVKGSQQAEVIVTSNGQVVEQPEWVPIQP